MRLKKTQKEAVLTWVAEGLLTTEINQRAADFDPPFEVSAQQVDFYRRTRQVKIDAIQAAGEQSALKSGLALKEVRVAELQILADVLKADLVTKTGRAGPRLWLPQRKSVGSGEDQEIYDYEEFNGPEVAQYRGVLDDIAKEVGHRKQEVNLGGAVGVSNLTADDWAKANREADAQLAAFDRELGGDE